jgi:poly-gamma-glutamate capsule biosynthesis protein CapA/YwtB (metallophosphatase superfamily)
LNERALRRYALNQNGIQMRPIKLSLTGDVMTGRGIDQILRHPSNPRLRESYLKSAIGYLELAESVSGPIPKAAPYSYIWGDALETWTAAAPDFRIVNLETSITTSEECAPKEINYRMHPANVGCLTAAGIDCCVVANNHILDWGSAGLAETVTTLRNAGITLAGAGKSAVEANAPAILQMQGAGRVLVFAVGTEDSGVPESWAAGEDRPGIVFLSDFSDREVDRLAGAVRGFARPGDIVVLSIHWGSNWVYVIPRQHQQFAHAVLDEAGIDVVYGHSSHHPLGIEVYKGKPILYGCGDFLNDYEGIGGYEEFRSQLVLLYIVSVEPAMRTLVKLEMRPFEIRRFRLQYASRGDAEWLRDTLNRNSVWDAHVLMHPDNRLTLEWQ